MYTREKEREMFKHYARFKKRPLVLFGGCCWQSTHSESIKSVSHVRRVAF